MAKTFVVALLVVCAIACVAFADNAEEEQKKKGKKLPACSVAGYAKGRCIDNSVDCCDDKKGEVFVDGDHCKGYSNKPKVVCCAKKGKGAGIPKKKDAKKKAAKKGKTPAKKNSKKPAKKGKSPAGKKAAKKPAKKGGKKAPAGKKGAKKPAKKSGKGWQRPDCEKVAAAWLKHKPMFSFTPRAKQYIKSGKGKYRTDCSGFVSAAWNVAPPGWVTWTFKYKKVARKNLQRCDALLCVGCKYKGQTINHAALFWGWHKDGSPVVVEEYTHGKHIERRKWHNSWATVFKPIRRKEW
jgi:hypothetical protein